MEVSSPGQSVTAPGVCLMIRWGERTFVSSSEACLKMMALFNSTTQLGVRKSTLKRALSSRSLITSKPGRTAGGVTEAETDFTDR